MRSILIANRPNHWETNRRRQIYSISIFAIISKAITYTQSIYRFCHYIPASCHAILPCDAYIQEQVFLVESRNNVMVYNTAGDWLINTVAKLSA